MGTSLSRTSQEFQSPSTQERRDDGESDAVLRDCRRCSSQDDDLDDGSYVFIDKAWSFSVSSAEDVLLIDGKYCDSSNELKKKDSTADSCQKETETSIEGQTADCSLQEQMNHEQESDKVEHGSSCRKESDSIDIIPKPCSVVEELPIKPQPTTEILLKSSVDNFTPPDINLTGKEVWIQISSCDLTLFEIYGIFTTYGSISALAKTSDHIYVKFSSWAGVANVFDDIRNFKQLHKFHSVTKVEDDELKTHPDRTEVHLDLPSCVLTYLKEHHELSKALNIITMAANDNICLNAPKIQHILNHISKSVSKGFQMCKCFPFGCHVLGSSDRSVPFEIFVDVGNMYAGCHKQSSEEQIAISKEIRKLISDDVVWYSREESPIAVFYHKTAGLNCILNFNNGFGDRCTRLLGVFMDYDERFRVLYLILDIWSKQCSLQGVSKGFNSYIVAVLLVFYLQVLPVPLLPPLHRIRVGRPVFIKGWDCTFIEDAKFLPRQECTTELHSLLRGFFVFYGSYDWKWVVCPVLGRCIDRTIFSSPSVPFPDDPVFANYLRAISEKVSNTSHFDISTSVCIQDFFNLSENIAKEVSSDTLLRFQSLCRQSHKMIYSAESRISFGSHVLHHLSHLPSAPRYMPTIRRRDQLANNFSHPAKFGSMSNCTISSRSWEQSSDSDHSKSDHGMYRIRERFSWMNRCEDDRENSQRHPNRQCSHCRSNYNSFNEVTRNQSNGTNNSRDRIVREGSSYSRSYRGRVFWHNSNGKNKVK